MNIHSVTVELLRTGPRYNQLLSRTTPYLGICGNNSAATVFLPYEHREFEHRLQELNYAVAAQDDPTRTGAMLDMTGREIAGLLGQIPGLAGALTSQPAPDQAITHLRIVLSASELAMLPFELSKVLAGAPSIGGWLSLLSQAPVCITRHIRSTSAEGVRWPSAPRILFVAGPDTPFALHRDTLLGIMAPWAGWKGWRAAPVVALENATLADVSRAVADAADAGVPFSHVHLLAHGERFDDTDRYSPVGIALRDRVVSGGDLARELRSTSDGRNCRPAVVTLATCDSGRVTSVLTPDASVAHDLHGEGIPFVVASQFQLSEDGAKLFIEQFYGRQLWGEHPIESLFEVRSRLSSRISPEVHDWAALVAYEAFPADLDDQLEELRYWQARRAQDAALCRVEDSVDPAKADQESPTFEALVEEAQKLSARLPRTGAYALECAGLRAAGLKRLALAAFERALKTPSVESKDGLFENCARWLEGARAEYWGATKGFLGPMAGASQRKANLHWLLGQVVSLDVVLGRRLDASHFGAAYLAARIDVDAADRIAEAWAHVSLSEFALLRLSDAGLTEAECAAHAKDAIASAEHVVEALGRSSEHATTTARQFDRYVKWWGNPELDWAHKKLGLPERQHWQRPQGLVATAKYIVDQVFGGVRPPRTVPPKASVSSPASAPSGNPSVPEPSCSPTRASSGSTFDIEMLPAENGDCLWIEYGDRAKPHRVLIDCGAVSTATVVKDRINAIQAVEDRTFDLFVLTHIDADHINGTLPLFADAALKVAFGDIWFNGWRQISPFLSVSQGEEFSTILGDPARQLRWNRATTPDGVQFAAPIVVDDDQPLPSFVLPGGMRLTLLSPGKSQLARLARQWQRGLEDLKAKRKMLGGKVPSPVVDFDRFDLEQLARSPEKKDSSTPNGSSIGFVAEFDGRAVLLTGDAHADVVAQSIARLQKERGRAGERLKLDAVKLAHHGSKNATTLDLLDCVDCPRYLVSTNGNFFYHPDREAIARVVLHGGERPTLYFNYRSEYNSLWDAPQLRARYGYNPVYPQDGTVGYRLSL